MDDLFFLVVHKKQRPKIFLPRPKRETARFHPPDSIFVRISKRISVLLPIEFRDLLFSRDILLTNFEFEEFMQV